MKSFRTEHEGERWLDLRPVQGPLDWLQGPAGQANVALQAHSNW